MQTRSCPSQQSRWNRQVVEGEFDHLVSLAYDLYHLRFALYCLAEEAIEGRKFLGSRFAFFLGGKARPHGRHYEDVFQRFISTQLAEEVKVGFSESADALVGDSMSVDDSVELSACTVSGGRTLMSRDCVGGYKVTHTESQVRKRQF